MSSRLAELAASAARQAKAATARALSQPAVGSLISLALRDRIRSFGVVIDTSPAAFTPAVKAQIAFGIYESAEIRFIRAHLAGFSRVLELGSSLGVTTSHILDVAAPGAEVVCVEANPRLLEALTATAAAAAARAGATVRAIHGAVGVAPGEPSATTSLALGRSSLCSRVVPDASGERHPRVPVVDLADLAGGWPDYAVVCDIEGAEAALIQAAEPVLTRARRLVIELHDTVSEQGPVTAGDLRAGLLGLGFVPIAEKGRVLALDGPASRVPRQAGGPARAGHRQNEGQDHG